MTDNATIIIIEIFNEKTKKVKQLIHKIYVYRIFQNNNQCFEISFSS
jgi:D-Tyr-tRNAtyr deacylase